MITAMVRSSAAARTPKRRAASLRRAASARADRGRAMRLPPNQGECRAVAESASTERAGARVWGAILLCALATGAISVAFHAAVDRALALREELTDRMSDFGPA